MNMLLLILQALMLILWYSAFPTLSAWIVFIPAMLLGAMYAAGFFILYTGVFILNKKQW